MKYFLARIVVFIGMVIGIIALVSSIPEPCRHNDGWREEYSFNSQSNTSPNYIGYKKRYCKKCDYTNDMITYFYSTPKDTSYLDLIREHSDGDELVDGEYYTMRAIVTRNYVYSINCKVENEDIVVYFSVDFLEEFKDALELIEDGDEITFRGKFVEMGYDWTDCELIKIANRL